MKGHAIRAHGAAFVKEGLPLQPLPADVLSMEMEKIRQQQRNSKARRRAAEMHHSVPSNQHRDGGFRPAETRAAAVVSGPEPLPSTSTGNIDEDLLDFSAAQMEDWELPESWELDFPMQSTQDVAAQTDPAPGYQPPLGWTPLELADFFRSHLGRRPSSIVELMEEQARQRGEPVSDRAQLRFWATAMTLLQRSLANSVITALQDSMRADPSGRSSFTAGVEQLLRLACSPLDP